MSELLQSADLRDEEDQWISVTDLMAVLMMIFLIIAVVYKAIVEVETNKIKEVAIVYDQFKQQLYEDLQQEFERDLDRWGAEIYPDLVVRFKEPDILFDTGSAEVKVEFQQILSDFFPRYVSVITSPKYFNDIEEVRVEGHTSSVCSSCSTEQESYFFNMKLSQDRTRSTLEYILELPQVQQSLPWLRNHVTANGLSFSRPVPDEAGAEDKAASRRVEFRVKTNAEQRIAKILEITQP